jgi:hypothetical protein
VSLRFRFKSALRPTRSTYAQQEAESLRLSGFGFQLDTGTMALLDLLESSVGDTFDRFMHILMLLFLISYRITGFLVQPYM